LADQLQAMSEDQKVHSVENDLELMLMPIPARKSLEPRRASSEPTTNPKNPATDGYSAEAPLPARRTVQGEIEENILGSRKEDRRRLNRSKNSLKEKHPRMMKEHQKCKEKNYFSLEKDTLLKLQRRKLKKNKSKSFKKS